MSGKNIHDGLESLKHIATNSVAKSGEIVESASDLLHGDIKDGAVKMASSITDIAATAATGGVSAAASGAAAVGDAMKKATGHTDDDAAPADDTPTA
ncbi:Rv1893 family protein [Gordonia sp. FQ]|uniref:Rv1893 family protein n=1 Tax=Gordonia sp. FQ TaxID=3446634 RepID=UPI003F85617A